MDSEIDKLIRLIDEFLALDSDNECTKRDTEQEEQNFEHIKDWKDIPFW